MPQTRPLDFLNMKNCVVVMPPTVRQLLPQGWHRLAMVSGWGLQGSSKYRYRTDVVLSLSNSAASKSFILSVLIAVATSLIA